MAEPNGQGTVHAQPVSTVEWIDRARLRANDYNPNHVAPPELRLLKISLLQDGWTQPLVVRATDDPATFEIVDGFHRWMVSADPAIAALTNGLVPIVRLRPASLAAQQMSTIRHNRARGAHHVVKMADIVAALLADHGLTPADVQKLLQMDAEEVERLADHGKMTKRHAAASFNKGWIPDDRAPAR